MNYFGKCSNFIMIIPCLNDVFVQCWDILIFEYLSLRYLEPIALYQSIKSHQYNVNGICFINDLIYCFFGFYSLWGYFVGILSLFSFIDVNYCFGFLCYVNRYSSMYSFVLWYDDILLMNHLWVLRPLHLVL